MRVLAEPVTVAVNCCVLPADTVAAVGEMETVTAGALTVTVAACVTDFPLPEAVSV